MTGMIFTQMDSSLTSPSTLNSAIPYTVVVKDYSTVLSHTLLSEFRSPTGLLHSSVRKHLRVHQSSYRTSGTHELHPSFSHRTFFFLRDFSLILIGR